jgi:hypothetical protein
MSRKTLMSFENNILGKLKANEINGYRIRGQLKNGQI